MPSSEKIINYECIDFLVERIKHISNHYDNEFHATGNILQMLYNRGEEYIDNARVAYFDDKTSIEIYKMILADGCCGFYDEICVINNRLAIVGYNFGH